MARVFSGRRLNERRDEAGLSRESLARRIDRSVWSITDYERGRALPSVGVLAAIADALGVSTDDLFDQADVA